MVTKASPSFVVPKQDLLDCEKGQRVWQRRVCGRCASFGEYAFCELSSHFWLL